MARCTQTRQRTEGNLAKRAKQKRPQPASRKKPRAKKAATSARKPKPGNSAVAQRLFGTDGIRAPAGTGPLAPHNVLALGRALGAWLTARTAPDTRPMVLLGVDPRPSADMVGTALAAGLIAECCDVHWPGMMSTPEVSFLTGHGPFSAGVSVTASHNPASDNGIKIFGQDGLKLPEAVERKLEQAVAGGKAQGDAPAGGRHGWLQLGRERNYEDYIVKTFRKSFASLRKRPLGVVFDAAFGARSIDLQVVSRLAHSLAFGRTVPAFRVGSSLQASGEAADNALDIYFMNAASPTQPETHHLINENCGSLHPAGCVTAVRELKADIGVCFDGDGDRCILIDESGAVRDGDHMLALLASDMKARGVLKNDTVVTTGMANLGLQRALASLGIKVILTDVGDKYVAEAMTKHGAVLGGEQSGHIIIRDEGHLTGDGLYTALRVIEVMLDTGKSLAELCSGVKKFPQTIVNVRTHAKPPLGTLKTLNKLCGVHERALGQRGRINVRYSGTEPLLRIMVEAEDHATLDEVSSALAAAAKIDLG